MFHAKLAPMPGRLFLTTPLPDIARHFGCATGGLTSDPPRHNIAPGQEVLVLTGRGPRRMRWGLIPVGRVNARGRPVMETIINARSETVFSKSAFQGIARGIVPADGWYEWTGEKRKKTAWRIHHADHRLLAFAAIWDIWTAPGGQELAQVAMVTCPPSADVSGVHHRMGVLLSPPQYDTWLNGEENDLAALMQPYPDGQLTVEIAQNVDWNGA